MKSRILCLFSVSILAAQSVSIGVKGGVPLTQAFDAQANPNAPTLSALLGLQSLFSIPSSTNATERTVPYTIGPAVEVRLAGHVRAEVMPCTVGLCMTGRISSILTRLWGRTTTASRTA